MQSYSVNSPDFSSIVIVESDLVIQTGPLLSWACGRDFVFVRRYIEQRGWNLVPLQEESNHPTWLEISGLAYELHWKGDTLKRVTLHRDGEEIDMPFEELPDQLKLLI